MSRGARRRIAVALHDVEPATFERCALIRDWLDDHGVGRVTMMVIPARDLHPLAERSPEMVSWLIERERTGDAIAQHGFQHLRPTSARRRTPARAGGAYQALRTLSRDRDGEFVGLDAAETRRSVDAGRRLLKLAGIEPKGFVAPGYAYTPALRATVSERFEWWAALLGVHWTPGVPAGFATSESAASRPADGGPDRLGGGGAACSRRALAPPVTLSGAGRLRRALSPALLRARGVLAGETLRLDVHPGDLVRPSHMLALEWLLAHSAGDREAVTYDQLASTERASGAVARISPLPRRAPTVRVP
jgi:predicted deacetylase